MRRLVGYTLVWIAIGMIIKMFLTNILISILLIFALLLVGYNLFLI